MNVKKQIKLLNGKKTFTKPKKKIMDYLSSIENEEENYIFYSNDEFFDWLTKCDTKNKGKTDAQVEKEIVISCLLSIVKLCHFENH